MSIQDPRSSVAPGEPLPDSERVWLIRAGRQGENEALALDAGVAIIGWSELGDVGSASREELKQAIRSTYGEQRPRSLASQAGEIYRFVHEVQLGDLVVLPLRSDPGQVAVGRITGEYEHRRGERWGPDARNTRATEWIERRARYEQFDAEIQAAFGQQSTVSEIVKPAAAERILTALEGPGAPPVDLVLKWSAARNPETIERHREVAERRGAVWWGRVTEDPRRTGMSARRLGILERQLDRGEETHVFLQGRESTWRTRLREITLDEADVDSNLVPDYYDPKTAHNLWVKLSDFEQIDPAEIVSDYVLESNGEPVTSSGLGNQGPLFVRRAHGARRPAMKRAAPFDAAAVRAQAERDGLRLPDSLYRQVIAALESGKHIIFTGPPGTAKTTLAQAVGRAAAAAGRCSGYLPTTATADWTTFETIGGLKPTRDQLLEFEPGHFLGAIEANQWLLIDELNRSNFDRAFGQLFTALSGQAVVMPNARGNGRDGRIVLLPEGSPSPIDSGDELSIPSSWRIIATMNAFDKTLLFEMSYALMRRFIFIEVASPDDVVFEQLIEREADGDERAEELTKRLLELRELKDLGPAIYMDAARYLRERSRIGDGEDDGELLFEVFYGYFLPQFEGIDSGVGESLSLQMGRLVGGPRRKRLQQTLNDVLGLDLRGAGDDEGDAEAG